MNDAHLPAARTGHLTRRSALLGGASGAALAALPLAAIPWAVTGCGGELALVVPFITFQFQGVVTDAGGRDLIASLNLNITAEFTGKATGNYDTPTIALQDVVAGTPSTSFAANGTFSGNSLTLNVPGATAPLATAYQGQFVEPDTILLKPQPSGPPEILLVRVDNSFRPALDASTWQGTDAQQKPWTMHFFTRPPGSTDGIELLTGDDVLEGQTNGVIQGQALMRQLEITVTRGGGAATKLSGRFGPNSSDPFDSSFAAAATLTFSDGSKLTRTSAAPNLP